MTSCGLPLFYQEGAGILQTNWFIASVLTEILLLLSIRSMLPVEKAGWPAPVILWLSGFAFVGTLLIALVPGLAHYFEFIPPSASDLALIVSLAFVYLIITELLKRPLARFLRIRS